MEGHSKLLFSELKEEEEEEAVEDGGDGAAIRPSAAATSKSKGGWRKGSWEPIIFRSKRFGSVPRRQALCTGVVLIVVAAVSLGVGVLIGWGVAASSSPAPDPPPTCNPAPTSPSSPQSPSSSPLVNWGDTVTVNGQEQNVMDYFASHLSPHNMREYLR